MKRLLGLLAALALFGCSPAYAQQPSWVNSGVPNGIGIPSGAQPFMASATTATATASVTIGPFPGRTIFVCSVSASETAGITAETTNGTITNLLGPTGVAATFNFTYNGSFAASAAASYSQSFPTCIPAVSVNTAVVATSPSVTTPSASNINVSGYIYGP